MFAAALEIDYMEDEPVHADIAEAVRTRWHEIKSGAPRALKEAKLGFVHRFGEALREIERRHQTDPAYGEFFNLGSGDELYEVRFAIAQELGTGGGKAFSATQPKLEPNPAKAAEGVIDPIRAYNRDKQAQRNKEHQQLR